MARLLRYRPGGLAGRVSMPLLVCVAERDTVRSVVLAILVAECAPRDELHPTQTCEAEGNRQ